MVDGLVKASKVIQVRQLKRHRQPLVQRTNNVQTGDCDGERNVNTRLGLNFGDMGIEQDAEMFVAESGEFDSSG